MQVTRSSPLNVFHEFQLRIIITNRVNTLWTLIKELLWKFRRAIYYVSRFHENQ